MNAYIKRVKFYKKAGYVDIIASYEIENVKLDIQDFVTVGSFSWWIEFRSKELIPKSLLEVVGTPAQQIRISIKDFEDMLNKNWSDKGGILSNDKAQFVNNFIQFIKENTKNLLFNLKMAEKSMPNSEYKFRSDFKFKQEIQAKMAQLQSHLNSTYSSNPIKQYIHFLETPVTIYQLKLIKICLSDSSSDNIDDLDRGSVFSCNHLGFVEIPRKSKINDEEIEKMWELLPKHSTFIIKQKERSLTLQHEEVLTGYWRYSPLFFEGFSLFVSELAKSC